MTTRLFPTVADLGEYLFRITDNGGATADRFTVLFSDSDALCLSDGPGVCQWEERVDPATLEAWCISGEQIERAMGDLSDATQNAILNAVNAAWADYLARLQARDPEAVVASRDDAAPYEGIGLPRDGAPFYRGGDGIMIRDDEHGDAGPFGAVDALRYVLPGHYALSGPEYHPKADPLGKTGVTDPLESDAALDAFALAYCAGREIDIEDAGEDWGGVFGVFLSTDMTLEQALEAAGEAVDYAERAKAEHQTTARPADAPASPAAISALVARSDAGHLRAFAEAVLRGQPVREAAEDNLPGGHILTRVDRGEITVAGVPSYPGAAS